MVRMRPNSILFTDENGCQCQVMCHDDSSVTISVHKSKTDASGSIVCLNHEDKKVLIAYLTKIN